MYYDIRRALRKKAAHAEAEDLISRYGPGAWSIAEDRASSAGGLTEVSTHQRRVARIVAHRLGFAARPMGADARGLDA